MDLRCPDALIQSKEELNKSFMDGTSLHAVSSITDVDITATIVCMPIVTNRLANREWLKTKIQVGLPVTMNTNMEGELLVVEPKGKIRVFRGNQINSYYKKNKRGIEPSEVYNFDPNVKVVFCQISRSRIALLCFCEKVRFPVIFIFKRIKEEGSENITTYSFGSTSQSITSFRLDEETESVWLGFSNGLLLKMAISGKKIGKRLEQYWAADDVAITNIRRKKERIVVSTTKGLVMFNNSEAFLDERRVDMPIGPLTDFRFIGNMLWAHRTDNGFNMLNLLTYRLEASIPPPKKLRTRSSESHYQSITMTEDHVCIVFKEGNAIHVHIKK